MTTSSPGSLASAFPTPELANWRGLVEKALKGADFDKRLVTRTVDGVRINPLYTRADALAGSDAALPGVAPLTRGTSTERAGGGWDIRTFHSETDAKTANAAILEDLAGGVTSIALHVGPTALPATEAAIGAALDGVLLDVCPIVLVADGSAFDGARALNAVWNARNIAKDARKGSFRADPLGTLAVTGRAEEPLDTELARAIALVNLCADAPGVRALIADGVCYHNAGASKAEELGAMLATVVAYLRAGERAGLSPDRVLRKMTIGLASDADEFSTIAKLRAARRLLWRIADACGAGDAARSVPINVTTSYRMMSRRDPWTNILRTTIACAGAALGGADSIIVLPFTYALGRPDAFARRVARNVQIVCQEESHLGRVADPAGGSWYVEKLTADISNVAWALFQQIERAGGMASALSSGLIQDRIAATAEERAHEIATGRQQLTGVSAFPLLGDDGVSAEPWPKAPPITRRAAITIAPIKPRRLGEDFEALRDAADAKGGLTVFVASLGKIVDHNVRTTWAKNYLAAGGIATLISDGYETAEDAAAAFRASGAKAACIASSDAVYETLAEDTARALKAAGAKFVILAGKPGGKEAALRTAGVDMFIHAGTNAVAQSRDLQARLG